MPTDHVLQCRISMVLERLQGGWLTTSLGSLCQCITTPSQKKFFLISNLNLHWCQFEAISSCSDSYLGEEADPHLNSTSFQVVVESNVWESLASPWQGSRSKGRTLLWKDHFTEQSWHSHFSLFAPFFFSCWSESNSRSTTKKIRSNQIFTVCMKQPQSFPRRGTVCSLTGPYSTPTPLLSQPQPPKLCTSFKAALQKSVSKAMTWRTPQNILRAEAHGGWYFFCYMSQLTATPLGCGINLTAPCLALSANRS